MTAMERSFYQAVDAVPPSGAGTSDSLSTSSFTKVGEFDVPRTRNPNYHGLHESPPGDLPEWIWDKKGGWQEAGGCM